MSSSSQEMGCGWGKLGYQEGGGPLAPHSGPHTHLLFNIRQRLDCQISKGREGLVGRHGSVLREGP